MKKLFKNSVLPTLFGVFAAVIIGTGCPTPSPLPDDDRVAPNVLVLSPNEGGEFFTDPSVLVIEATATDEYQIVSGAATVYNALNEKVDYYEETSETQGNKSITRIYTTFKTSNPGNYKVEFKFEDIAGNVRTVTRNVVCKNDEIDGETDN